MEFNIPKNRHGFISWWDIQTKAYGRFFPVQVVCMLPFDPFHFTSLHFTSLHFTSLHLTLLHFTSLTSLHFTYFTSLHFTSLYFTLLYFTSLHFTSLHFTLLHCNLLCLITFYMKFVKPYLNCIFDESGYIPYLQFKRKPMIILSREIYVIAVPCI